VHLIGADLQPKLWNYLAGIARNRGMHVLAVGGTGNHVHILMVLPADAKLSDALRTLKANSSRWVRESNPRFGWQEGYGAFSVSPSQLDRAKRYIANQAEHRRRRSFEDEFMAMLHAADLPFEPNQVFG
jgi:REP element-mobilizing transposase RayT